MVPLAALVAFVVSAALVWSLSRNPWIIDEPNHRSLHSKPIPRAGGVGLMLGVFAGWAAARHGSLSLALAVGALMIISFIDDVRRLAALTRLRAHVVIAALFFVDVIQSGGILAFFTMVVAAVWMANLYNFMDGSDGLAAGMGVIGFGVLAATSLPENLPLGITAISVAAAVFGFLLFNFHPAKIFMGDSGSVPLGFLAAAVGYWGWADKVWPWWYPILIFSPFIVDATVTLSKRLARREKIWEAHREHYYQRLVRMGWGHRKTAVAEYALMLSVGALATVALSWPWSAQLMLLAAVAILYLVLARSIDKKWASQGVVIRDK